MRCPPASGVAGKGRCGREKPFMTGVLKKSRGAILGMQATDEREEITPPLRLVCNSAERNHSPLEGAVEKPLLTRNSPLPSFRRMPESRADERTRGSGNPATRTESPHSRFSSIPVRLDSGIRRNDGKISIFGLFQQPLEGRASRGESPTRKPSVFCEG